MKYAVNQHILTVKHVKYRIGLINSPPDITAKVFDQRVTTRRIDETQTGLMNLSHKTDGPSRVILGDEIGNTFEITQCLL